jgi:hypothetical protein
LLRGWLKGKAAVQGHDTFEDSVILHQVVVRFKLLLSCTATLRPFRELCWKKVFLWQTKLSIYMSVKSRSESIPAEQHLWEPNIIISSPGYSNLLWRKSREDAHHDRGCEKIAAGQMASRASGPSGCRGSV